MEDNKFTWGECAVIREGAPVQFHPGEIVSICSLIKISPEDVGKKDSLVESTWLYTVEFADGSSIEVPECYLKPYEDNNKR